MSLLSRSEERQEPPRASLQQTREKKFNVVGDRVVTTYRTFSLLNLTWWESTGVTTHDKGCIGIFFTLFRAFKPLLLMSTLCDGNIRTPLISFL